MSYEIDAVVFYGFPVPRGDVDVRNLDGVGHREFLDVSSFGCGISGTTPCLFVRESWQEASLGQAERLTIRGYLPHSWNERLRQFCDKNGILWPEGGPWWHFAARRS